MNESTKTKKALRGSLFALFLCIVLLIGTTFAWFTDTASTGVNKIQAGNLDVNLQYKNADQQTYKSVTKSDKLFKEGVLWEPGHVEYVNLKVSNEGNLALNYKLKMNVSDYSVGKNVYGEKFKLSEYLEFAVVDGAKEYTSDDTGRNEALQDAKTAGANKLTAYSSEDLLYAKDATPAEGKNSKEITLIVYMPETVGNEANAINKSWLPSINLGVTLNAIQATVESDSFDNQYDKGAATTETSQVSFSSGHHDITGAIHANGGFGAFQATNSVTATIDADIYAIESKNGDVTAAMAVWAKDNASIVINGGNFSQKITGTDDQYDLIYASQNATITINGGTFKCATPKWTLNCLDNSKAKITVNGGKFYKFNPETDNPGEVVLGTEHTVEKNGDWYIVK